MARRKKIKFKVGDFVEGIKHADSDYPWDVFGLVAKIDGGRISYLSLEKSSFSGKYSGQKVRSGSADAFYQERNDPFKIISKEEVLDHLQSSWGEFEEEIELGGLLGALAARGQYNLDKVRENLQKTNKHVLALERAVESPHTGTYVLQAGIRTKHFDGLLVKPRRNERIIAKLAEVLLPGGTDNIPSDDRGRILYEAYEIPEKGIHLVEKPIKLVAAVYRKPVI